MSRCSPNATAIVGTAAFNKGVTDTVWKVYGREFIYMYVATGILVATSVALVVYVCVIRKRIAKTNDRFSALEQTMAQHQWNCPQNLDDAGCIRGAPNVHSSAPDDRMTQNIELEHQSNGDVDITIHRTRVVEVEHETY